MYVFAQYYLIDQWKTIANILKSRNINILFDMAYQGFATGDLNQDSFAPRLFIQKGINISLCQSFSKNMGLYGERIGALHVITNDKKEAKHVLSQLKNIVRPMYSNPPINGARIVSIVLDNKELTNEWQNELKIMSSRITQMRKELRAELEIAGSKKDWSHIVDQIGMFCFSGLSKNQVEKLVNEYSIYLTKDGRISMAGVNPNNVEYLAKSIHSHIIKKMSHFESSFLTECINATRGVKSGNITARYTKPEDETKRQILNTYENGDWKVVAAVNGVRIRTLYTELL
ncbi:hypothetical protein A3Q56_07316 [Intoshia linei]|uniref:Aspartate aminotransferase n=1 Tax=Intoshia linei TaxID=1819745 RepID=A0A177AUT8_9BILA|nr:hypothetical protein A3Q56_07316 [Intoshia linei]